MKRVVFLLADVANMLAAACALILATLGTADVIGNFVFNSPILGTKEYSSVILACLFFLGMAAAVRGDTEISVDVVLNALPSKPRMVVEIFNRLATTFFFGVLTFLSWRLTLHSYQKATFTGGSNGFRLWPFEAAAAVGVTIALLCMIAALLTGGRGEKKDT